ncbi:hypothetical protein BH11BAC5_BH11BAC5_42150 [soil metagenome]|jgi:hypothetical protein
MIACRKSNEYCDTDCASTIHIPSGLVDYFPQVSASKRPIFNVAEFKQDFFTLCNEVFYHNQEYRLCVAQCVPSGMHE